MMCGSDRLSMQFEFLLREFFFLLMRVSKGERRGPVRTPCAHTHTHAHTQTHTRTRTHAHSCSCCCKAAKLHRQEAANWHLSAGPLVSWTGRVFSAWPLGSERRAFYIAKDGAGLFLLFVFFVYFCFFLRLFVHGRRVKLKSLPRDCTVIWAAQSEALR